MSLQYCDKDLRQHLFFFYENLPSHQLKDFLGHHGLRAWLTPQGPRGVTAAQVCWAQGQEGMVGDAG